MKTSFNIAAAALAAFITYSPHAARAQSLQAFAGVVGGGGSGNIAAGCTTYGPPAEVRSFFGGSAAGLQVLGGNAACGYSGGWTNLVSTTSKAPLLNSASLAPTLLGVPNPPYFVPPTFDGTASSRASYGSLGVAAHGNQDFSAYTPTAIAAATGAATFSDTLTASVAPTYTDLSNNGFVRYRFSIDGSMTTPGTASYGDASTAFGISQLDSGTYVLMHAEISSGNYNAYYGTPVSGGFTILPGSLSGSATFESGMFSIDLTKCWDFEAGLIVNATQTADDNFYSTAKLVGIDLFDVNGHPITGFSLSSASGTDYIAAVPEPTMAGLMLIGLTAVSFGVCRRRRPWN